MHPYNINQLKHFKIKETLNIGIFSKYIENDLFSVLKTLKQEILFAGVIDKA